jgi:rubrerythrin
MVRQTRTRIPNAPTNAKKVYPTKFALAHRGEEPKPRHDLATAASEQSIAIRCFQCGSQIENPSARSVCPFCDSDNFRGRRGP